MSFLKGKNILIVGGNGYVGNRVASRLVQHNANVSVLSRGGPRFNYAENQKINWLIGDVMQAQKYRKQINQADTIIHTVATLFDTSITKFKKPGQKGTYQHMNRDTFLSLLKLIDNKKKIIYMGGEGHPPFIPRYQTTKNEAADALFASQHQGYVLKPGFIFDADLKKWSIPLRHTIRMWNKFYPYIPLHPNTPLGRIWAQLKQSQPTSLNKIADCISYISYKGYEQKILNDQKIRQASEKYTKIQNQ